MAKEELEGADSLRELSSKLLDELVTANKRLAQSLTPKDVLLGIRKVAGLGEGDCILLQPGSSGYAWSDRTIPLVFLVRVKDGVRIRVRRGKSYRNSGSGPGVWPQLRGFPRGDVASKLQEWSKEKDGVRISIKDALNLPAGKPSCEISKWKFSSSK